MQPETTQSPAPLLVRDPLRDVRLELERLRLEPEKTGPIRIVAAKSKPEANRERRDQAIRRAAFELLVAEEIDAASVVFVGVDHVVDLLSAGVDPEPHRELVAVMDPDVASKAGVAEGDVVLGAKVLLSSKIPDPRTERLGERWAKAREKRERRKTRRGGGGL